MTIKLITFDLDNTLWDVEPVLERAEQAQYQWLQEHRPRLCEQLSLLDLRDFKNNFHRDNPQYDHQIGELRLRALAYSPAACQAITETKLRVGLRSAFDSLYAVASQG